MSKSVSIVLCFLLIALSSQANTTVDLKSLLEEMVDRDALPKVPLYPYRLKQTSSYDRASKSPAQDWYANLDGSGFIRTEINQGRTERVLMEDNGPGAIVRFWATYMPWFYTDQKLRFYIDGEKTPTIEGRFADIVSGKYLVNGVLSDPTGAFLENNYVLSAKNLYLPIPYQKSVKVTYEGDEDTFYYIINYRSYQQDTPVTPFNMEQLATQSNTIKRVQKDLETGSIALNNTTAQTNTDIRIAPNDAHVIELEGARAIRQLMMQLQAKDHNQALRSTVLSIEFDGKQTIWAPIGDFFAIGYKPAKYQSRYMEVTLSGEMYSRWVMPFRQKAIVKIHNFGHQVVDVKSLSIHHSDWQWNKRSMYFNASWQLLNRTPTARGRDENYITLIGRGKYVGDSLAIYNGAIGNEPQPWWGEGDEKIYFDGEDFPSHFGTGTEDYYGHAWVSSAPFSTPFVSQPTAQGNRGQGLTVNSRWRILDAMPFESAFKFDMEIWSWVENATLDYATTKFWYGDLATTQVLSLETKEKWQPDAASVKTPVRLTDFIEGEGLLVDTEEPQNKVVHTIPNDRGLRNRSYWMLKALSAGDSVSGQFFSGADKQGVLEIAMVYSPKSMIVDVFLNDQLVLADLDLYRPEIETNVHRVKNIRFVKGVNKVTVRAKSVSKHNIRGDEAGIDYLRLITEHKW